MQSGGSVEHADCALIVSATLWHLVVIIVVIVLSHRACESNVSSLQFLTLNSRCYVRRTLVGHSRTQSSQGRYSRRDTMPLSDNESGIKLKRVRMS